MITRTMIISLAMRWKIFSAIMMRKLKGSEQGKKNAVDVMTGQGTIVASIITIAMMKASLSILTLKLTLKPS